MKFGGIVGRRAVGAAREMRTSSRYASQSPRGVFGALLEDILQKFDTLYTGHRDTLNLDAGMQPNGSMQNICEQELRPFHPPTKVDGVSSGIFDK